MEICDREVANSNDKCSNKSYYQLDAIFVYFSSTCFGLTRASSGAIEFIISFTNAAYGVLGAARCRS